MCGIAGLINLDGAPVRREHLEAMVSAIRHRGPDGEGHWVGGSVGLGHARLSIIDLAGGAQPMPDASRRRWIVFNGEIYNFRELRKQLEGRGQSFRTQSDTEVVLAAWVVWGVNCVHHLRGMFSFAVVDLLARQLFMARDHLGIKPLYWTRQGGALAFGSELQALRAWPGCPTDIDPQALDHYLRLDYIPAPGTVYRGVYKLAPAHRLLVHLDHGVGQPERYWRPPFGEVAPEPPQGWSAALVEVLKDSVQAHLVADVPFGAFLSGGIDSTAVVGWMHDLLPTPVRTFAIGFDDPEFDELSWARRAASAFGTEHVEQRLGPEILEVLPKLVRHYGEPFGDSSALPTYFVSQLARQSVPMVLTGDGGDEAFLGYGRYSGWLSWIRPGKPHRGRVKAATRSLLHKLMPRRFPADVEVRAPRLADWLGFSASGNNEQLRNRLWRHEYRSTLAVDPEPLQELAAAAVSSCAPEQFGQFLDYTSYLPDDVLTKVDIASMAHGLETRTPLTDVRVAEFVSGMPWRTNLRRMPDGRHAGKYLLKTHIADRMGADFVDRPKAGFSVPLEHWFASPTGAAFVLDRLGPGRIGALHEWFEPKAVRELVGGERAPWPKRAKWLWKLLFLEEWLRSFEPASRRLAA